MCHMWTKRPSAGRAAGLCGPHQPRVDRPQRVEIMTGLAHDQVDDLVQQPRIRGLRTTRRTAYIAVTMVAHHLLLTLVITRAEVLSSARHGGHRDISLRLTSGPDSAFCVGW